ncbi:Forkhead associated (FHA) domain, binds pSer, pThr, pTyr [Acetitomaculum ruminis DSM 5522]|uniref:Forkhead associated (FHA) domain, binds pSer, pThr, pTyr n=1 Tax=Acetitomaculum ruminis DSM 5522 TaxID=1120918 RepID=A0A1I0Y9L7_9FIRM|nr:DUF6382 domain-containing protein [Acetitomaculum ruminis]SFB09902.1 Forkhead associated (FHA) domain, binds pSer, pThr, pTyr [Acetitomaculum ruminis DSM 5522]
MDFETEIKEDLNYRYLIISDKTDNKKDYQRGMILNNDIPGFLKCSLQITNGQEKFYFDISKKETLEKKLKGRDLYEGELGKILSQMVDLIKNAREYLLNEDNFIFRPEYIFFQEEKMYFCFMPGLRLDIKKDLHDLSEFFMKKINHDLKNDTFLAYEFFSITMKEDFKLSEIEKIIKNVNEERGFSTFNSIKCKDMWTKKQGNVNNLGENVDNLVEEERENCKNLKKSKNLLNKKKIIKGKRAVEKITGILAALAFLSLLYFLINDELKDFIGKNKIFIAAGTAFLIVSLIIKMVIGIIKNKTKKNKSDLNNPDKNENKKKEENIIEPEEDYGDLNSRTIYSETIEIPYPESNNQNIEADFTDLEDEDTNETIALFSLEQDKFLTLHSKNPKDYPDITLKYFPFIIGKNKDKADGLIDKKFISRFHVKFDKDDENIYITDLNSLNGVMVNGNKLEENETLKIHKGDDISIASLEYILE